MIKEFIEGKLGKVTDNEFNFAERIVKNFISGELGGIADSEKIKELMLETIRRLRDYNLYRFEEWA